MGCNCGKRFSNSGATVARPASTGMSGRQIVQNQTVVVRSQNFTEQSAATSTARIAAPVRRTV